MQPDTLVHNVPVYVGHCAFPEGARQTAHPQEPEILVNVAKSYLNTYIYVIDYNALLLVLQKKYEKKYLCRIKSYSRHHILQHISSQHSSSCSCHQPTQNKYTAAQKAHVCEGDMLN